MEFKTKHNINEIIWFYQIGSLKIMSGKITDIFVQIKGIEHKIPDPNGKKCMKGTNDFTSHDVYIEYGIDKARNLSESEIFLTKADAKKSLLDLIEQLNAR